MKKPEIKISQRIRERARAAQEYCRVTDEQRERYYMNLVLMGCSEQDAKLVAYGTKEIYELASAAGNPGKDGHGAGGAGAAGQGTGMLKAMKTSELTGADLDYWVAKAEGLKFEPATARTAYGCDIGAPIIGFESDGPIVFMPSTNWAEGGPILEREKIVVTPTENGWYAAVDPYRYRSPRVIMKDPPDSEGPTALIAAMRAYVASKFGEEVTP